MPKGLTAFVRRDFSRNDAVNARGRHRTRGQREGSAVFRACVKKPWFRFVLVLVLVLVLEIPCKIEDEDEDEEEEEAFRGFPHRL